MILLPRSAAVRAPRGPRTRLLCLVAAALAAAGPARAAQVHVATDERLVVELETLAPTGPLAELWLAETALGGFTGASYLRWASEPAPALPTPPAHGVLRVDFEVPYGGPWQVRLRNGRPDEHHALTALVWARLDGGAWQTLVVVRDAPWSFRTLRSGAPASFELAAGRHTLELAGAEAGVRLDRLHLFKAGDPQGNDPALPPSPTVDAGPGSQPPLARFHVAPRKIPADDARATLVTLDATNSWDADAGQHLEYFWDAPGATFEDGSSPLDPIARVTYMGGTVYPVRLAVRDTGSPPSVATATTTLGVSDVPWVLSGAPLAWHPLELDFEGPVCSETQDGPNPFLDLRLEVELTGPQGQSLRVPGFYAGDGAGGGTGGVWRARFRADTGGEWTFRASFRQGPAIAATLEAEAGAPLAFDGVEGSFRLFGRDPAAPGFLARGALEYVGEHYLRFREGGYFLKGGTDSPENLLAFRGFDHVEDWGGLGVVHSYAPHVADWRPGDPLFQAADTGVDSKGLVGALNWLADHHVNAVYFLPMNLGGDGQDTCPFVSYAGTAWGRTHFDVSRLRQWDQVFRHAQRRGIVLQMVLSETEVGNETWLDGGAFGVERRLYLRELVARFGYLLGLKWNLGEESDFPVPVLREMAAWIRALDPWDHPLAVHTWPDDFSDYEALLGDPRFTATSIQYTPDLAGQHVETWRRRSGEALHPWVLDMDENGSAAQGVTNANADDMRKRVLYDVYFSGGQLEWYAGYHPLPLGGDVSLEDFRTREEIFESTWFARRFLEQNTPFWAMLPADELLTGESGDYGGGEVFALPGEVYAVYLPCAEATGTLDLGAAPGTFLVRWYDPRSGAFAGVPDLRFGSAPRPLGPPPAAPEEDWVVLLQRVPLAGF